jgi:hypothetical protein
LLNSALLLAWFLTAMGSYQHHMNCLNMKAYWKKYFLELKLCYRRPCSFDMELF